MSVGLILVNITKKEKLCFAHLPFSTRGEILGNPIGTQIISLYLIENMGDHISFVLDQYNDDEWSLEVSDDMVFSNAYKDVTEELLDLAEKEKIIPKRRKEIFDKNDPDVLIWEFD